MRKFLRLIKWLALGLGLLVSLLIVAAAIYVRTKEFTQWAREQAVAAINEQIRGEIAVERLEGSLWGNLNLHDVVLRYENEEVAAIPRLNVDFHWLPLIWGRVQIRRIDAEQPKLNLIQSEAGEWNVIGALSPRQPETEVSSAWVVSVNSLVLRNGSVALRLAGPNQFYNVSDVSLKAGMRFRPAGASVEVQEVASLLSARNWPDLRLKGALSYQQSGAAPAALNVKHFWVVSRLSQIKLDGQLIQAEPFRIKAQAVMANVAAADVAAFVAGWPVKHDVAGNLTINGPLDALNGSLELSAAGAKIAGEFQADAAAETPTYMTQLTFSGFQLRRWLDNQDLSGTFHGTATLTGRGFTLPALIAKANLEIRGAEAYGWSLGNVSLAGSILNSVAAVDGRLKSTLGEATWSGKIGLQEKPAYDLVLAINDLDIQRTIPGRQTLEGKLNLKGSLKGSGWTFGDINTRAEIQILPSTLGPIAVTQGVANVSLSDKKLRIAHAALSTAESTLTVAGELGLEARVSGNLSYRLQVAEISPWLSLLDRSGSGSVNLSGQAHGSLAALTGEGTARLSNLRLEGVAVRDGNIKFTLQGAQDELFPSGTVTARLIGVDAGVSFRQIDATANLAQQPMQSITLRLYAQDTQARKHSLSATVEFLEDRMVARLREAQVESPGGTWTLVRPAVVTKSDDTFLTEQLSLRSGGSVVSLNGQWGFTGAQGLTVTIDQLPLKTLWLFVSEPVDASGVITAEGRITGTAASPEISAVARLKNASIAGQAYAGARTDLNYKDKLARVNLEVQQDATHRLIGAGTVPVELSWHNGARAVVGDRLDFRAQSGGISLAFLNAFSGKALDRIDGEVSLDLTAHGSIKRPEFQGTFGLRDGKVKVVPLGVDVVAITVAASLDSRNLIIREISAKAKDGEMSGRGSLGIHGFDLDGVKLSLNATRWPAIQTERYQARVTGNLDVQGSLAAPKLTGTLTVADGTLRPDLAFLEQSKVPLTRDETIIVIKNNRVVGPSSEELTKRNTAKGGWFEKVSLNLTVNSPGNLWIRHPDLVSELSGNVGINKAPGRQLDFTGRIEIMRGWMAFQGRRFQLVRGAIEFTGGDKIAPSLNIVANNRVQGYEVQALVSGTSEKPTLTLTSQPRLDQADILALLIFGKPLNALNKHEQGSVQQSALSITSGFVAANVAKSVSRALGLDSLGLDISDVDFAGGTIGLGRYVAPGTYVSFSEHLAGERGHEVSIEYQIVPDWSLSSSTASSGSSGIDIIWRKRY
ncbi:MAG: translocation/assembly module TamB domain-containing protein [Candidatus Binatia bacterium]